MTCSLFSVSSILGDTTASRFRAVALLVLIGFVAPVQAQTPPDAALQPVPGPASNIVQVLEARGDSLWVGPNLALTTDGGASFREAEAPALQDDENVLFAVDVRPDLPNSSLVAAGLAFDADGQSAAGGFLLSRNGGETFRFEPPALDAAQDTTITYGVSTLSARPIVQEAGSAPQDLATSASGDTLWLAAGLAGIRYSANDGASWQRVVLPPDTLDAIDPGTAYDFRVAPAEGQSGFFNHIGSSVLVDASGTVWAGTVGGLNRSTPADRTDSGARAWQRFTYTGTPDGLTGNNVVRIAEQVRANAPNALWLVTWPVNTEPGQRQRFGVTRTTDDGASFTQTLVDERIFDLAFDDERVYAAGDNGLFVSDDNGATWVATRRFALPSGAYHRPDAGIRAVATTRNAVWVGTTDGLLRSADGGLTWQLFRASAPLDPNTPGARSVDTYAYPNPFTPSSDRVVRIRYARDQPGTTRVRILDFSMRRVRTLRSQGDPSGEQELVWDGTDENGLRLPNGTYFYEVETDRGSARGKILLID